MRSAIEAGRDRRIAQYYLGLTLERQGPRRMDSFTGVLSAVERFASVELPPSLVEALNFRNELLWFCPYPHDDFKGLSLLFTDHDDIPSSKATIEIARRVTLDSAGRENYEPTYLRVGGIMNGRVVGMTYDLKDSSSLVELNTSLSCRECPDYLNNDWDSSDNLRPQLIVSLPSSKNEPYKTAAVITQEMCKTAAWKDPHGSPHRKALVFQVTQMPIFIGKALQYKDFERLAKLTARLGYYAIRESGNVKVGFKKPEESSRDFPAWEIQVPRQLQRA